MMYAKAIVGALAAFCSSLVTALGDNQVSYQEWVTAVGAALAAGAVVWGVRNAVKP